jgi:hypothetical protein
MSKTFNTTLVAGTNQYFDLHDYVHDIPEAYVAAEIAKSTAWRIDTLIVSNARRVFKNVRSILEEAGVSEDEWVGRSFDHAMDIQNAMQQIIDDTQVFGVDDRDALRILPGLVKMRTPWHELAKEMAGLTVDYTGSPRRYDIPDLDDVFMKEPNLKIKAETQRRMAMSTRQMAAAEKLSKESEEKLLERRMQREKDNLKSLSTRMVEQAPVVWDMAKFVIRETEAGSCDFYKLPVSVQDTLLTNAKVAAQRADDWACKERSMSDMEYSRILACVLKVDADLRKVIGGERFVIAQRVAEAATI